MLQLNTPRELLNQSASVGAHYPQFDKKLEQMSKRERKEFQRLDRLVKIQHVLPKFLCEELSGRNDAMPPLQKVRQKLQPANTVLQHDTQTALENSETAWMAKIAKHRQREAPVDFETLVRIRDLKQEFCHAKSMKRSERSVNDHELLKPFAAKEPVNYQKLLNEILDGTHSLKEEERKANELAQALIHKRKPKKEQAAQRP